MSRKFAMLAFHFYFLTMISWFFCSRCKSLHQSLSSTLQMFAFEAKLWAWKINRKVCLVLRQPRICIASKSNELYNAKLLLWIFQACIMERLVHKKCNNLDPISSLCLRNLFWKLICVCVQPNFFWRNRSSCVFQPSCNKSAFKVVFSLFRHKMITSLQNPFFYRVVLGTFKKIQKHHWVDNFVWNWIVFLSGSKKEVSKN